MAKTVEPVDPMKLFEIPATCGIIRAGANVPAPLPPGAARKPRRRSLKSEELEFRYFRDHLVAAPLKRFAAQGHRCLDADFRDPAAAAVPLTPALAPETESPAGPPAGTR